MSVVGSFIWTFLGYCFHRFLFHIETKSYWANTFHYLIHGCHHGHPMDGLRLVIPPAEAAILAIMVCIYDLLFFFSILHDACYKFHHWAYVYGWLQKYHLNHHLRIQNKGFGLTTTLWDRVFGTLPKTKSAEKIG
ncbi:hypothetical protein J1N35_033278 [Gossypium stocksii]|uniref:Fatty acid hydroxylase domain-containing protein n=1 Tax=Gossypium stocksii TaxID=47602 RepID=A0A9D3UPZ6_9ROSI|nr:hypothetical protein J1N35_033278 [Gossypium stocksii]